MDRPAAARAIGDFLRALGHEPEGELASTPELVAQAWCDDLLDGEGQDAAALLTDQCIAGGDTGLVILRGLSVVTICPHHLLPATGTGDVFYLPTDRVAGFGAVVKSLRALTRRLTLQEHAGAAMAQLLVAALGARGAGCRLRLTHSCLSTRGARETGALVETIAFEGSFGEPGPDRDLALATLTARSDQAG